MRPAQRATVSGGSVAWPSVQECRSSATTLGEALTSAYSQPMAGEHRVAGHLGVAADDYDRTIRAFIPSYERMIETAIHWLEGHVPAGGLVVDLGAGTGALSAAILDALPEVRVELVDIDPNMLEVAATEIVCAHPVGTSDVMRGSRIRYPGAMRSSPRSLSTT